MESYVLILLIFAVIICRLFYILSNAAMPCIGQTRKRLL